MIIFSLSPSVSGPQLLLKKEMFMRSCWINRKSRHALILSTVRASLCLLYTHSHLNTVMCRRCFCLCVRWAFMGIRSKHLLNQIMQHSYTVNQNNIKLKLKRICSLSLFFLSPAQEAIRQVNHAVSSQDKAALLAALRLNALALLGVQESNSRWYLEHFTNYCQHKSKVYRVRACLLSCWI